MLYACQDLEFDRREGLRSIPVRFGVAAVARGFRARCTSSPWSRWRPSACSRGSGRIYVAGVVVVAALLVYEQSLVSADDLSQVKRAFDLNGWVGLLYFAATALDVYWPEVTG